MPDYTSQWTCPEGHVNPTYLLQPSMLGGKFHRLGGSSWDYCYGCNAGPTQADRERTLRGVYCYATTQKAQAQAAAKGIGAGWDACWCGLLPGLTTAGSLKIVDHIWDDPLHPEEKEKTDG